VKIKFVKYIITLKNYNHDRTYERKYLIIIFVNGDISHICSDYSSLSPYPLRIVSYNSI